MLVPFVRVLLVFHCSNSISIVEVFQSGRVLCSLAAVLPSVPLLALPLFN